MTGFLFVFKNSALMENDKKKQRKKNFLPAKIGITGSFLFCVYFMIGVLSYTLEVETRVNTFYAIIEVCLG